MNLIYYGPRLQICFRSASARELYKRHYGLIREALVIAALIVRSFLLWNACCVIRHVERYYLGNLHMTRPSRSEFVYTFGIKDILCGVHGKYKDHGIHILSSRQGVRQNINGSVVSRTVLCLDRLSSKHSDYNDVYTNEASIQLSPCFTC